ncbi:MAG: DUF6268 family outer membrane beta-barrel protein [Methylacidiphilales bacterium]|nr:DUF6268 family outer membrane beta-barrel protein [Candidatus Methylacidiphilales bacterium]
MAALLAVFVFGASHLMASDPVTNTTVTPDWLKVDVEPRKVDSGISHEFNATYSYVGDSKLKYASQNMGNISNSSRAAASYIASIPIVEDWHFRVGAEYERYDFGLPSSSWLPNRLESADVVLGVDANLSEKWLMRAEIHPGIYGDFQQITMDNVNIPAIIGFTYLVDSKLQWFFGLGIDPRFGVAIKDIWSSPVFPGIGVRWQFADDWTLMAVLPKPELEYKVNEQLEAFAGGEILGGNYRMGSHFGDHVGRSDLNNEDLSYREIRAGLGLRYKFNPAFTVEANGGIVLEREFRYSGRDLTLETEPAPYAAVQLKANF